jgi:hypothetical protein
MLALPLLMTSPSTTTTKVGLVILVYDIDETKKEVSSDRYYYGREESGETLSAAVLSAYWVLAAGTPWFMHWDDATLLFFSGRIFYYTFALQS